jgi:hypothetical protein
VVQHPGFFLRQDHNLPRPVGKPLKTPQSALLAEPLPSPTRQTQDRRRLVTCSTAEKYSNAHAQLRADSAAAIQPSSQDGQKCQRCP